MNKYLKFFLKDQMFILHFIFFAALCAALIFLNQYKSRQARPLKILREERALVFKIDSMKNKIRSRMAQSGFSNLNLNPQVKVEGAIHRNGKAFVLINNTIYQEGDTFGDYKLMRINSNSLVLFNIRTHEEENVVFGETSEDLLEKNTTRPKQSN